MKNDRFRIDIEHTTLSQTEASIKDNWIWTKPYVAIKLKKLGLS